MRSRMILKIIGGILCAFVSMQRFDNGMVAQDSALQRFFVTAYEELPMVVIIPSYNNSRWYERNLDSVFMQHYHNYRVIYIDDCSSDGTGQLVYDYITHNRLWHRVTLIRNKERLGAMANWYRAIHSCYDDEVVINLDGDDWFAHPYVLQRVNEEYQTPDVWLTYGQMRMLPWGKENYCGPITYDAQHHEKLRSQCGLASHLRTYYAWLFKQIKIKDVMFEGKFLPMTCDRAMMAAMLEMGPTHFRFIPDVLYIYNAHNPITDGNVNDVLQNRLAQIIFQQEPYAPLAGPIKSADRRTGAQTEVIITSCNAAHVAQSALAARVNTLRGVRGIQLLYSATNDADLQEYQTLSAEFPDVVCTRCEGGITAHAVQSVLAATDAPYAVLLTDADLLKKTYDMQECVAALEQTKAYAFYLTAHNVTRCAPLNDRIGAFQFGFVEGSAHQQYQLYTTVYRTQDLHAMLQEYSAQDLAAVEAALARKPSMQQEVGLYFQPASVH